MIVTVAGSATGGSKGSHSGLFVHVTFENIFAIKNF
jgi:hypothetical protein